MYFDTLLTLNKYSLEITNIKTYKVINIPLIIKCTYDGTDYSFYEFITGEEYHRDNSRSTLLKGEKERVSLTAKSDILILQKKTDKDIDYKKEIKIKGFTYPLYKGDELGVLYIKDNDKIIAKGILTINENIKKVGYFKLFITNLKNVLGGN